MGSLYKRDEERQRKRMEEPVSFFAPHILNKKSLLQEDCSQKKEITLMKLSDRFGSQEIKADLEGRRTSFTVISSSPCQSGELKGDMRAFNRAAAQKQRRTADADVLLAGGLEEGAVSVEADPSSKWTDARLKLMRGDGTSRMLEQACPYADDTPERKKLAGEKEHLQAVRWEIAEIQRKGAGAGQNKTAEGLRKRESRLAARVEALTQLIGKKDYIRRLMLQRYRYATSPLSDGRFFARIRALGCSGDMPGYGKWREGFSERLDEAQNAKAGCGESGKADLVREQAGL
ncbi:hypothetical protein DFR58_12524 [Anaerobacterium chartisolvens]|uniref:Uncharacterized protein n=1 Tax=Anaerobacterium chartisolvens TaxID=1297424 RepID=A0A369ASQ4_9FIRM|nr:hypothetical protein [Anaerobacterium chartisolvens]RCX11378.1 hypothetical protein DFR58_12524 [Anaerobacterium chartisolvens]